MRIYVTGHYGRSRGLSDEECEANALRSVEWGRKLILKGHNPFIPNLFHWVHKGWFASPEEDVYFDIVKEWIRFCHAIFVPELPEHSESGVRKEMLLAVNYNIPIYYDIEDIPNARVGLRGESR